MTVDEASKFFDNDEIKKKLEILKNVGLEYLELGQTLDALSGGEVQRVNMSKYLGKKGNIFVFDDIRVAIECLKSSGRRVYAAALDKTAVSLDKVAFGKGDTAIVGNEGHGLSPEAVSACTQSLYIPMEEGSESLNAGVAASVILWKMYRG